MRNSTPEKKPLRASPFRRRRNGLQVAIAIGDTRDQR